MWLFLLTVVSAEAPDLEKWANRAEGAAVRVKTEARSLGAEAAAVAGGGRVGRLPVLAASADELVHRSELLVRVTAP